MMYLTKNYFLLIDDEPTAAQEREAFIALTRASLTAEEENEEQKMFMTKTQKRMMKAETKQNTAMPKVCKGMPY